MVDENRYHGACHPCSNGQLEDHGVVTGIDITGTGLKTTGAITFSQSFSGAPKMAVAVEVNHASDDTLRYDSLMVIGLDASGCTIKFNITTAATTATEATVHWMAIGT